MKSLNIKKLGLPATLVLLLAACSSFQGPGEFKGLGNFQGFAGYNSPSSYRSMGTGNDEPINSGNFTLVWPVRGRHKVNQGFSPRNNRKHAGLDIAGSMGTNILSAHSGRVVYTGHGFRGYGNMIIVEHSKAWASLYAHLRRVTIRQGAFVDPGQKIGEMGRSGRATGVHLHFELLKSKQPVNPLRYLRN